MNRAAKTKQKTKDRVETAEREEEERGVQGNREQSRTEREGECRERERAEWNKLKLIWCSAF